MKTWSFWLKQEFAKPYFINLWSLIEKEYQTHICYPELKNIFRVFELVTKEKIKVVILGQDPYHRPNQADGLAFSVNFKQTIPPSLRNIFKKLQQELNIPIAKHGNLTYWAKQGVFLFNTIWSVRAKKPLSHDEKGWEQFTEAVIMELNRLKQPIVFLLWGKKAQFYEQYLNNEQHLILKTSHPSPFSANQGFFQASIFSSVNQFLQNHQLKLIDWKLPIKL